MTLINGGEALAATLVDEGIARVFTLCGNHTLRAYKNLHDAGIALVDNRNEACAVMAADADARINRKPSVALVTGGPGLTNALTGLLTAHASESPVVLLSGQNDLRLAGKGAQQELDQAATAETVCKWSATIENAADVGPMLKHAFRVAMSGTTGSVHLSIPSNVLKDMIEDEPTFRAPELAIERTDTSSVLKTAEMIRSSRRPVIIAGSGAYMARAENELTQLVEKTNIPLFTVDLAKGMVPDNHRCVAGYGDPSLNPAAAALTDADCVILIGKRLDFRLRFGEESVFARDAKLIDVHSFGAIVDQNRTRDLTMEAEIADFLCELRKDLEDYEAEPEWLDQLQSLNPLSGVAPRLVPEVGSIQQPPFEPAAFVEALKDALPDNATLVFDGGDFVQWCRMALRATGPGRWLRLGPMSTCGAGTGLAFGASCARPGEPVILITGDGSFGYYLSEIEAAARQNHPFVAIVGHNNSWGLEQNLQKGLYGEEYVLASHLSPIRYDRVAEALGGYGELVDDLGDLAAALERALSSGKPACLEVPVKRTASALTQAVIARNGEV